MKALKEQSFAAADAFRANNFLILLCKREHRRNGHNIPPKDVLQAGARTIQDQFDEYDMLIFYMTDDATLMDFQLMDSSSRHSSRWIRPWSTRPRCISSARMRNRQINYLEYFTKLSVSPSAREVTRRPQPCSTRPNQYDWHNWSYVKTADSSFYGGFLSKRIALIYQDDKAQCFPHTVTGKTMSSLELINRN
uniref:Uncharacterized protein n=1 Tax=Anopheles albimanus TaxID=7167 RepID=A0A182FN87_ANOAL